MALLSSEEAARVFYDTYKAAYDANNRHAPHVTIQPWDKQTEDNRSACIAAVEAVVAAIVRPKAADVLDLLAREGPVRLVRGHARVAVKLLVQAGLVDDAPDPADVEWLARELAGDSDLLSEFGMAQKLLRAGVRVPRGSATE